VVCTFPQDCKHIGTRLNISKGNGLVICSRDRNRVSIDRDHDRDALLYSLRHVNDKRNAVRTEKVNLVVVWKKEMHAYVYSRSSSRQGPEKIPVPGDSFCSVPVSAQDSMHDRPFVRQCREILCCSGNCNAEPPTVRWLFGVAVFRKGLERVQYSLVSTTTRTKQRQDGFVGCHIWVPGRVLVCD
jgi:hypothetical protein